MIALRGYQTAAVEAVWDYFKVNEEGNPLIVMPTGTGKSLVIAELVRQAMTQWTAHIKIMMLTHVKELIEQNVNKLLHLWPEAPVGIYSAGLNQRNVHQQILYCGIQSVWNKADHISSAEFPIDLIIIDEAHCLPFYEKSLYRKLISQLQAMNPFLRVIGLTATPYRYFPGTKDLSAGYVPLTYGENRLFTDVVFDSSKQILALIKADYLSALWPQPTKYTVNLKGIKVKNGDYQEGELGQLMSSTEVMNHLLSEAVETATADARKHWLVFCVTVEHAEKVTTWLTAHGISAGLVTGDTPGSRRSDTIYRFKTGQLTALVSVGVLTTGFDAPETDCIILARPTLSPVLHVQILGRGLRPTAEKISEEVSELVDEESKMVASKRKRGCLVLDFVGNIKRHGPINNITLKAPSQKKEAPKKTCPACKSEVGLSTKVCEHCGYEFLPPEGEEEKNKKKVEIGTADIIQGLDVKLTRYEISRVQYSPWIAKSGNKTLRVDYFSGFMRVATEWVCFNHAGYARKKAEQWWAQRALIDTDPPVNIEDALTKADDLNCPTAVVIRSGATKFPEIDGFEWAKMEEVC